MKQRKKYYSRKFLNKDEGMAAIECIYDQHDARWGADISINITDCHRKVNLDFSIYDTKVIAKKIDKLRRFRDEINKLLEIVEANAETIKEAMTKYQKERKGRSVALTSLDEALDELQ